MQVMEFTNLAPGSFIIYYWMIIPFLTYGVVVAITFTCGGGTTVVIMALMYRS